MRKLNYSILFCFSIVTVMFAGDLTGKFTANLQQVIQNNDASEKINVWIYFNDKGVADLNSALFDAQQDISERALNRRAKTRNENLVDERDIPVCAEYIQQVLALEVDFRVQSKWLNAISISAIPDLLANISDLPFVKQIDIVKSGKRIEPEQMPTVINPPQPAGVYRNDYGESFAQLEQINVIAAHEASYTGEGVVVMMLDTGYFTDHEALHEDQIIAEWDFINDDGETQNEAGDLENQHSHGTATLSALGGMMDGVLYGPAYNAQFLLAKTEDTSQEEPIEEDWYVAGLEWGENLGADVASSSLGYIDWYDFDDLDGETAVTTIAVNIAIENGMIVATAAGNSGNNGIIAPADAFEVLTCGAVNSEGEIASFSSRGPTVDGRIKPEICARGVGTYCAGIDHVSYYRDASGTSLSTPLIGGAIAVILSAHPDWTPQQVRYALMMTADNADDPDNIYGWGIIDVMAAIDLNLLMGDVNDDEILNVLDLVTVVNFVLNALTPTDLQFFLSDLNSDGTLDILDVVLLVNEIIILDD